jgi:hypothetical protein
VLAAARDVDAYRATWNTLACEWRKLAGGNDSLLNHAQTSNDRECCPSGGRGVSVQSRDSAAKGSSNRARGGGEPRATHGD